VSLAEARFVAGKQLGMTVGKGALTNGAATESDGDADQARSGG
jgi:hypothetical protein